ncbi:acyloxyacyl hydrolase [Ramlibacter sp. USB13]|uniref:Lipid A deacylase n=1 Tax=Ramlibacter cellulosilyticus TaxID=2764187 RepID=A0A923SAB2_9BURK|nr:acyloxyacyl hydrolase [Ramlibacter cellulosilyticus]MBC5782589.1 acyloxyacyl hydrolase [Ramlibacter cellulosilyticus]
MTTTTTLARACATGLLALSSSLAHAVDWQPDAFTVKAGIGEHNSVMAGGGLRWDWDFQRMRRKSELTAHTEVMLNEWRAERPDHSGYRLYTQVVVLPSLRMRLDRGASPWFLEFGIGLSWMSHKFETPDKQFSTEWNFYDVLGVGYTFGGAQGKHEVDLRLVHFSNAGLRDPNPGLNFVQVRYTREF